MNKNLNIIFENKDIFVIDKQSYISVLKNDGNIKDITIIDILKKEFNTNLFPISTFDYEATGIVLIAKNKKAYDFVAKQFKQEKVSKIYHIIANGIMDNIEGTIDRNLIVNEQTTSVNNSGIKSITKYFVIEQFKNFAFVKVFPLTTRKNQIRAHFWSIGNTLAIDKVYGSDEPILLSNIKRRYKGIEKEKPLLKRLPLHLSQIEFVLPGNKEKSVFNSPLPDDISLTLKQLRKYNKRG